MIEIDRFKNFKTIDVKRAVWAGNTPHIDYCRNID